MSMNRRFALNESRKVIDAINAANSGKGYCHEGDPEDDKHLRGRVLQVCLGEILEKLIINVRPTPGFNEERHAVWVAVLDAIRASHLNTFDPALSVQHKFDGKLSHQKEHAHQNITSLSLFRDDVESLLRDLYGNLESEALDSLVWAVFGIVREFTKYVRPDIWKEHEDAVNFDYILGIGVPEGYGISGSEWRCGMAAKFSLIQRVREVNAKPSAFSEYTIEFANLFAQWWDCSKDCGKDFLDEVPF